MLKWDLLFYSDTIFYPLSLLSHLQIKNNATKISQLVMIMSAARIVSENCNIWSQPYSLKLRFFLS